MCGEQQRLQRAVPTFPDVRRSPGVDLGDRQRRVPAQIEPDSPNKLAKARTREGKR